MKYFFLILLTTIASIYACTPTENNQTKKQMDDLLIEKLPMLEFTAELLLVHKMVTELEQLQETSGPDWDLLSVNCEEVKALINSLPRIDQRTENQVNTRLRLYANRLSERIKEAQSLSETLREEQQEVSIEIGSVQLNPFNRTKEVEESYRDVVKEILKENQSLQILISNYGVHMCHNINTGLCSIIQSPKDPTTKSALKTFNGELYSILTKRMLDVGYSSAEASDTLVQVTGSDFLEGDWNIPTQ